MFFVHRFIPVSLFDNTAISMAASGSEAFCNGCPHVWEADGWFAFIKTCVFLMDTWLANRWSLGPIWDSHPPPNRCFIEKAAPLSLSACTLPYTLSLFTLHRSSFNCFFSVPCSTSEDRDQTGCSFSLMPLDVPPPRVAVLQFRSTLR